MSKFWVCEKCLPEEVEELSIGALFKTPCIVCGEAKEPSEMKCVRKLPEHLEKRVNAELEDMKNRIAAGMGIPKEFLEPTLTGHASILVAMDKEILKMTEETAEHAKETIEKIIKVK